MSTAQIKSAFIAALGNAGTCTACTMQYVEGGKMQLLRFYVRFPGVDGESVLECRVPRGESLIVAAREKGEAIRENPDDPAHSVFQTPASQVNG